MTTTSTSVASDERILSAAAEVGSLGTGAALPGVLARLCDPLSSAEDVAQVVAREPGLSARVLRVANSAYYRVSGSVATLDRAFVMLGVDAVRGIAAAACLDRTVTRALHSAPLDAAAMLRHSLATAVAAEALAGKVSRRLASEAFVAGLLHDFGIAVQLQVDRAAFGRLVRAVAQDPDTPVHAHEHAQGCVSHERCAAISFAAWKLPATLVEAVGGHHALGNVPEAARPIARAVFLATRLSVQAGFGHELEPRATPDDAAAQAARAELGLSEATLTEVAALLDERVRALLATTTA